MKNIILAVSGMSCQGCADSLSRLFEKEPGISSASVSFDTSKAELSLNPDQVSEARLSEIIDKAGFSIQ